MTFEPLEGIRVIDFTRLLAGPYATMTLAELGADVIKVEIPEVGDETRTWGPPFIDETSAYFHAINRGKRSVVLDLRHDEGREAAFELIATADIVVENFRPGVADRLGIGPDQVLARFPHIIYGSISGFGASGPMSEHPGTEVTVEAESGLMNVTGLEDGEPVRFGVAMVDISTGMAMINGVLAALVERHRTGRGRRIDVSLFATAISSLGTIIASASSGGGTPRPWGSSHPSIVPYRAFAAQDGYVVLGASNDAMFQRMITALGLDADLGRDAWRGNAGRVADRHEVEAILQARVADLTVDDVVSRLRDHRVLVAPVRKADDAARSEQATALDVIEDDDGLLIARSALSANGTRHLSRAPFLGQHTREVLDELAQQKEES